VVIEAASRALRPVLALYTAEPESRRAAVVSPTPGRPPRSPERRLALNPIRPVAVLVLLILAAACGAAPAESGAGSPPDTESSAGATPAESVLDPAATIAKLLELAEAGDWETYVDDFYGEANKFEEGDRDKLVARFRDQWGPKVIEGLKGVVDVEPRLSDEGSEAIFEIDGQIAFKLFRDAEGRWTFHL
jgi:hypothetical protein